MAVPAYEPGPGELVGTIALPCLYLLLLGAPGIIKEGKRARAAVVLAFFMVLLPGVRLFAWLAGADVFMSLVPVLALNSIDDLLMLGLVVSLLGIGVTRQKASAVAVAILLIGWAVAVNEAGVHPIDLFILNVLFEVLGAGTFLVSPVRRMPV